MVCFRLATRRIADSTAQELVAHCRRLHDDVVVVDHATSTDDVLNNVILVANREGCTTVLRAIERGLRPRKVVLLLLTLDNYQEQSRVFKMCRVMNSTEDSMHHSGQCLCVCDI